MFYRSIILAGALMLFICGCSDNKAPDPPSARAELTARLFDTLKEKRYNEALAIIDKLLALDANDAELMEMRDRIVGNVIVSKVQKYIDNQELEKALRYIQKERKTYPVMPRLRILEEDVRSLIALRNAARRLAAAKTIPELTAALDTVTPMAARYPAATQLHKDIAVRKADLKKMREAAARAAEKAAAQSAAAKAVPPAAVKP